MQISSQIINHLEDMIFLAFNQHIADNYNHCLMTLFEKSKLPCCLHIISSGGLKRSKNDPCSFNISLHVTWSRLDKCNDIIVIQSRLTTVSKNLSSIIKLRNRVPATEVTSRFQLYLRVRGVDKSFKFCL